jgi:hypothetical protein
MAIVLCSILLSRNKSNILPDKFIGRGQGKLPFFAFTLSLIPSQAMNRVTQQHSQRVCGSSEEFPTKKTRKLLRRFRKQRRRSSEDTRTTFADKQVVGQDMCIHKSVT